MVMDSNGEKVEELTNNGASNRQPKWSPDKKYIAFLSDESGNTEINRIDLSQEDIINVTSSLGLIPSTCGRPIAKG